MPPIIDELAAFVYGGGRKCIFISFGVKIKNASKKV